MILIHENIVKFERLLLSNNLGKCISQIVLGYATFSFESCLELRTGNITYLEYV